MRNHLETCKSKVEDLLMQYPLLRDSDKLLWLAFMNRHHGLRRAIGALAYDKLKSILLLKDTPTFESIRRVRQKIQEEGRYQGKKRAERMEEEAEVRKWAVGK